MKRRDFITLLGGAVAWPLAASAQQTPKLVIACRRMPTLFDVVEEPLDQVASAVKVWAEAELQLGQSTFSRDA